MNVGSTPANCVHAVILSKVKFKNNFPHKRTGFVQKTRKYNCHPEYLTSQQTVHGANVLKKDKVLFLKIHSLRTCPVWLKVIFLWCRLSENLKFTYLSLCIFQTILNSHTDIKLIYNHKSMKFLRRKTWDNLTWIDRGKFKQENKYNVLPVDRLQIC